MSGCFTDVIKVLTLTLHCSQQGGGGGAGRWGLTVYPLVFVGLSLYLVLLEEANPGALGRSSALCLCCDSRLSI